MEVWTCKQNSKCFCDDGQFVHNRREITDNGQLVSSRRQPCSHFWRDCPHCLSFTPDGSVSRHSDKKFATESQN